MLGCTQPTYFVSSKEKTFALSSLALNPQKGDSSPIQLHNKRDADLSQHLFYGVDEVTILEPNDKEIVTQNTLPNNIYQRIVHTMKQSTQEYYNMRMLLGLKCA